MNAPPSPVQRHKEITLLFLKHSRLSEDEADERRIGELADDIEGLGPTFVRLAQGLSTRGDLLGQPYLDALARVRRRDAEEDAAEAQEVEGIIEHELGGKMGPVFSEFDFTPYAFASAGQIHRAELRSGGVVSVKVQRPQVRQRMVEDLQNLAEIASFLDGNGVGWGRGEFARIVEEFRVQTMRGLDYSQEASNFQELGRRLADYRAMHVPGVIERWCSPRVLTTTFIGCRGAEGPGRGGEREVLADELLKSYLDQVLVSGVSHASPGRDSIRLSEDGGRLEFAEIPRVVVTSPRWRGPLIHLLCGLSQAEALRTAEAAMGLAGVGADDEDFDRMGLVRRIAGVMGRERSLYLDNLSLGNQMVEVLQACARAGLRMPEEVQVIARSLMGAVRAAGGLCPTFDAGESIRWHLAALSKERDNEPIPFPVPRSLERVG